MMGTLTLHELMLSLKKNEGQNILLEERYSELFRKRSIDIYLKHFMPLLSFYTHWKHQKTSGFLIFSGGIERYQWHEMGLNIYKKFYKS